MALRRLRRELRRQILHNDEDRGHANGCKLNGMAQRIDPRYNRGAAQASRTVVLVGAVGLPRECGYPPPSQPTIQ